MPVYAKSTVEEAALVPKLLPGVVRVKELLEIAKSRKN